VKSADRLDTEGLKKLQRALAWSLPALATLFTLIFFVSMASGAAWLSRTAFGRFGSVAILVSLGILAYIGIVVWAYGRLSTAIERRSEESGAPR
jgi:hypothetical protein